MSRELEQKTKRLVEMLEHEHLDAVLLNAQHNFAWLTGGGSNRVDASRENGVASLMVTREGKRFILASRIEIERMLAEEVSDEEFEPIDFAWQDEKANGGLVIDKARSILSTGARVASDLSFAGSPGLIENKISPCRYELTEAELMRIRDLGSAAAEAMRGVAEALTPGQSEFDIAESLRHHLGLGRMSSVVTLVAADDRIARFRHPVPTAKSWQNAVLIVTCAKRSGLIVSMSRLVVRGDVPDNLRHRTEACTNVHARILDATKPGATGSSLYFAAAKAYADNGFAGEIDLHHQGGPAGYKTREWVAHPASSETAIQNQAFAWNPSVTGTKVEDTYVLTAEGMEAVTVAVGEPRMITEINGRQYSSPGIITI